MNDESTPRDRSAATGGREASGQVEIDAPIERVWRALTEAAELERWFPLEARVEPGEGGSIWLSWGNEYAGDSKILVWEPPNRLRISWGAPEEMGGGPQVTDYLLEAHGGRTVLRVVTSGFSEDPTWDDWVESTQLGWRFELVSLKRYLEHFDGRGRQVIYLRRRVRLGRQEAWDRLFAASGLSGSLAGARPFDDDPPRQWAAMLDEPPGALLRVSTEPCASEPGARDVTLWLSAWGVDRPAVAGLEADWAAMLERLYPEGRSM